MKKEEFIKKYNDSKLYTYITDENIYFRIKNILKTLNIEFCTDSENNNFIIHITDCFEIRNINKYFYSSIFIEDWLSVSESKSENTSYLIDAYLKENNFKENTYNILTLNSLIGILNADWINLITTNEYCIYWNNFNNDLIITIRNHGSFKIKF